jgi:hypothetical protein
MRCLRFAFAAVALLWSGSAHADVTYTPVNILQPNEESILLNSGLTATTVFGTTNLTGITVAFTSTESVTEPSSGNAITAADGLINNLAISVPGGSFEDLIIDPVTGSGDATVTAVANEPGGGTIVTTFTYALANGHNFLTITASNGETLASVTIDAAGGFTELLQPKISGASTPVAEPTSLTALALGMAGIVCYGWLRAKRPSPDSHFGSLEVGSDGAGARQYVARPPDRS